MSIHHPAVLRRGGQRASPLKDLRVPSSSGFSLAINTSSVNLCFINIWQYNLVAEWLQTRTRMNSRSDLTPSLAPNPSTEVGVPCCLLILSSSQQASVSPQCRDGNRIFRPKTRPSSPLPSTVQQPISMPPAYVPMCRQH